MSGMGFEPKEDDTWDRVPSLQQLAAKSYAGKTYKDVQNNINPVPPDYDIVPHVTSILVQALKDQMPLHYRIIYSDESTFLDIEAHHIISSSNQRTMWVWEKESKRLVCTLRYCADGNLSKMKSVDDCYHKIYFLGNNYILCHKNIWNDIHDVTLNQMMMAISFASKKISNPAYTLESFIADNNILNSREIHETMYDIFRNKKRKRKDHVMLGGYDL